MDDSSLALGRENTMRALLLSTILLISPSRATAQTVVDAPAVILGTRVRVTVDSSPTTYLIGAFIGYRADALWLQQAGASPNLTIRRAQIVRLEASRGQRSYGRLGASVGLLLGAAVGTLTVRGKTYDLGDDTPTLQLLGGMALGGVVGAGIGANIHRDRWEILVWPKVTSSAP